MSERGKRLRLVRLLIIILGIIGIISIASFPFDNRNIKITFITEKRQIKFLSNDIIAEGQFCTFSFENTDEIKHKRIIVYGNWESVLLKGLDYGSITSYVAAVDEGTMRLEEDGIVFTGDGTVNFTMNNSFVEMVQDFSATLLQERLVLMGFTISSGLTMASL